MSAGNMRTLLTPSSHRWNRTVAKTPPKSLLTFSSHSSPGQEVQVLLIDSSLLEPRSPEYDKKGTILPGQQLLTGVDNWAGELPPKKDDNRLSNVIFDDLSISLSYMTEKILKQSWATRWSRRALTMIGRLTDTSAMDSTKGHFGRPALVRVKGGLYPIIVNGSYVLFGDLIDRVSVSSRVNQEAYRAGTKDTPIPFFAALNYEIKPSVHGNDLSAFDEELDLDFGDYQDLFLGQQTDRKNPVNDYTSKADLQEARADRNEMLAEREKQYEAFPRSSTRMGKRLKSPTRSTMAEQDEAYEPSSAASSPVRGPRRKSSIREPPAKRQRFQMSAKTVEALRSPEITDANPKPVSSPEESESDDVDMANTPCLHVIKRNPPQTPKSSKGIAPSSVSSMSTNALAPITPAASTGMFKQPRTPHTDNSTDKLDIVGGAQMKTLGRVSSSITKGRSLATPVVSERTSDTAKTPTTKESAAELMAKFKGFKKASGDVSSAATKTKGLETPADTSTTFKTSKTSQIKSTAAELDTSKDWKGQAHSNSTNGKTSAAPVAPKSASKSSRTVEKNDDTPNEQAPRQSAPTSQDFLDIGEKIKAFLPRPIKAKDLDLSDPSVVEAARQQSAEAKRLQKFILEKVDGVSLKEHLDAERELEEEIETREQVMKMFGSSRGA